MKILITGSSGLVGHALQENKHWNQQHTFIFVSSRDADLRDYKETFDMLQMHQPDAIIHLAANVGDYYI